MDVRSPSESDGSASLMNYKENYVQEVSERERQRIKCAQNAEWTIISIYINLRLIF